MPSAPQRKFTVADAMILVAVTAAGFMLVRPGLAELIRPMIWDQDTRTRRAFLGILVFCPCVSVWTLTILALRLRRPRPRLRRLIRQPGAVACGAVALVVLIRVASILLICTFVAPWNSQREIFVMSMLSTREIPMFAMTMSSFFYTTLSHSIFGGNFDIGIATAAAWTLLALSGRWRPEPDWLDRAGRAVGVFWVGMIAFEWVAVYIAGV